MKKTLRLIELFIVLIISIIIYKQTLYIIKDSDILMTELKSKEKEYYVHPQNAIIKNETVIPGINGKKVDIEKTYKIIKKIKSINEKYIIYKEIPPQISLENNKNKYIISGNNTKNEISIILEIDNNTNTGELQKILKSNNIQITFQIDNEHNNIERLSKNKNYELENKNPTKANRICILDEPNEKILKLCSKQNKYTVITNKIIKQSPFSEIKKILKPGLILKIYANENTLNELDMTIKYIKSKGLNIKKISDLISEKNNN